MRVLILGCGPAGLFAAEAALSLGCSVGIVSKKRRSEMFGAQYLHAPIPGISNDEPVKIHYRLQGTSEGYRRKVYGNRKVDVSPDVLSEDHWGWDIRAAYYESWRRLNSKINDFAVFGGKDLDEAISEISPDLVFSTIPATILCLDQDNHHFKSEEVYAIGDAPERGIFCPIVVEENTVVCNGEDSPAWYRASNVFGYASAEWPARRKPPIEGVSLVTKPISNDCNCYPNIIRLGRYGQWKKGVLSHTAYYDTEAAIQDSLS